MSYSTFHHQLFIPFMLLSLIQHPSFFLPRPLFTFIQPPEPPIPSWKMPQRKRIDFSLRLCGCCMGFRWRKKIQTHLEIKRESGRPKETGMAVCADKRRSRKSHAASHTEVIHSIYHFTTLCSLQLILHVMASHFFSLPPLSLFVLFLYDLPSVWN